MDSPQTARGLEIMAEVYGTTFGLDEAALVTSPPVSKALVEATVEHLFANVWGRSALSIRDRRLVTMGITAAMGRDDLLELQLLGALANGELDEQQVGELILQIAHYAGWPMAAVAIKGAERAVARDRATPDQTQADGA
jgi:4-carboxymuconolactone decarboxylase